MYLQKFSFKEDINQTLNNEITTIHRVCLLSYNFITRTF